MQKPAKVDGGSQTVIVKIKISPKVGVSEVGLKAGNKAAPKSQSREEIAQKGGGTCGTLRAQRPLLLEPH